jgi:DNA-binding NarL/FixJ family response regulator
MESKNIRRLLIAHEHYFTRKGFETLVKDLYPKAEICLAKNTSQIAKNFKIKKFDLIIINHSIPGDPFIQILSEINKRTTTPKVILISDFGVEISIRLIWKYNVLGFIKKEDSISIIKDAINNVASGMLYLGQNNMSHILNSNIIGRIPINNSNNLNEKELEIAKHLLIGNTISQISDLIGIKQGSVNHYKCKILKKLGIEKIEMLHHYRDFFNWEFENYY